MDGVGEFDASLIHEATELAARLRELPAGPKPRSNAETRALECRNRLLLLLTRRGKRVRSAARYVFRNHPEIARQAMSSYERRRRANARRAAMKKPPADK